MKLAEIPQEAQNKYGVTTNPGLVTDPLKTKGFLMSGKILNVQAVYFEIFADLEGKLSCGFEVAQFGSAAEMENVLTKTDKKSKSVMLLTLKNYLIIAYGPTANNNIGNQLDAIAKYFEQKLNAKIYRDRLRDVETAVSENYVTNLPPPLPPPGPKNATRIELKDLDKGIANSDGLAYMLSKKREKLAPGNYVATSSFPAFETLSFTLDTDSLLHGDYLYHYAEDYSKPPTKESKLRYDHGVLMDEILYVNGSFKGSTTHFVEVKKNGNDFLITHKTITKSPAYGDKEIKTVFRNKKPISKITTRFGVSVIRKDFEKNTLKYFNNKEQLTKLKKPGLIEEYDSTGKITYKEEWVGDNQFIYRDGKLRYKEMRVKGKDQYLATEYDESGKVSKEWYKGYETYAVSADPDEYESDMTAALFDYYKKKAL